MEDYVAAFIDELDRIGRIRKRLEAAADARAQQGNVDVQQARPLPAKQQSAQKRTVAPPQIPQTNKATGASAQKGPVLTTAAVPKASAAELPTPPLSAFPPKSRASAASGTPSRKDAYNTADVPELMSFVSEMLARGELHHSAYPLLSSLLSSPPLSSSLPSSPPPSAGPLASPQRPKNSALFTAFARYKAGQMSLSDFKLFLKDFCSVLSAPLPSDPFSSVQPHTSQPSALESSPAFRDNHPAAGIIATPPKREKASGISTNGSKGKTTAEKPADKSGPTDVIAAPSPASPRRTFESESGGRQAPTPSKGPLHQLFDWIEDEQLLTREQVSSLRRKANSGDPVIEEVLESVDARDLLAAAEQGKFNASHRRAMETLLDLALDSEDGDVETESALPLAQPTEFFALIDLIKTMHLNNIFPLQPGDDERPAEVAEDGSIQHAPFSSAAAGALAAVAGKDKTLFRAMRLYAQQKITFQELIPAVIDAGLRYAEAGGYPLEEEDEEDEEDEDDDQEEDEEEEEEEKEQKDQQREANDAAAASNAPSKSSSQAQPGAAEQSAVADKPKDAPQAEINSPAELKLEQPANTALAVSPEEQTAAFYSVVGMLVSASVITQSNGETLVSYYTIPTYSFMLQQA
jgi:hypothetical protein